MKKKILVLYQDWGDWLINDYSKFEYWFKKLDRAYSVENEYFILVLGNVDKLFKPERNVTVQIIKSTPIKQFLHLFKFRNEINKIILNFKPTSIYSSYIYLLSQVKKSKSYKIIGFVRDKTAEMVKAKGGIRYLFGNIIYILDYLAFKNIDLVLHNGESMKKYAIDLNFKRECIYCPRPIVDFDNFNIRSLISLKKELNLNNKKIILSIARLTDEKNLMMGVNAMKYLGDAFIYLIVGEGNQKNDIMNKISELNLQNKVKLVGFVSHNDIWRYYSISDLNWLLSKTDFEGTPNVLQEAYFSQTPCVVSKISAMQNIVDGGIDSLILDSWSSKELAEKTKSLLNDEKKYSLLQKNQKIKINSILEKCCQVEVFFK
jgi:glycosyltransferase involved in cell wall biosynthesis